MSLLTRSRSKEFDAKRFVIEEEDEQAIKPRRPAILSGYEVARVSRKDASSQTGAKLTQREGESISLEGEKLSGLERSAK